MLLLINCYVVILVEIFVAKSLSNVLTNFFPGYGNWLLSGTWTCSLGYNV